MFEVIRTYEALKLRGRVSTYSEHILVLGDEVKQNGIFHVTQNFGALKLPCPYSSIDSIGVSVAYSSSPPIRYQLAGTSIEGLGKLTHLVSGYGA